MQQHVGGKPLVVLRGEYISDKETELLLSWQRVSILAALALLIWETYIKFDEDPARLMRTPVLETVNAALAPFWLLPLLGIAAWWAWRVWLCRRAGQRWTPLQWRTAQATALALALQLVNAGCWLAVNAIALSVRCSWFGNANDALTFVSWTCWNTLFFLHTWQAVRLVPPGTWDSLRGRRRASRQPLHAAGDAAAGDAVAGAAAAEDSNTAWEQDSVGQAPSASTFHGSPEHSPGLQRSNASTYSASPIRQPALGKRLPPRHANSVRTDVRMAGVVHAVAGLLWLALEAMISAMLAWYDGPTGLSDDQCVNIDRPECLEQLAGGDPSMPCWEWNWDCTSSSSAQFIKWAIGLTMVLHTFLYVIVMMVVLSELKHRSYTDYRMQNVLARLQLRTRVLSMMTFLGVLLLLWYISSSTCSSHLQLVLGLGPLQIAMCALVTTETFLSMPSNPDQHYLPLHEALQQFAWTEAQAPAVLQERGLPQEPLFCFETALKCSYFSLHLYRHFRPESTITSLDSALDLYDLAHYEWLREPIHDMNCLLAWSGSMLVIAFRGTASLANVKADAKFWRGVHPPKRGTQLLCNRPMVHAGFLASWQGQGLNTQVLQRVRQILDGQLHTGMEPFAGRSIVRCCSHGGELGEEGPAAPLLHSQSGAGQGGSQFHILVTGHSLGGSQAQLCALDVAKALPEWGYTLAQSAFAADKGAEVAAAPAAAAEEHAVRVGGPEVALLCYTLGCPRVGNKAFAREFKEACSNSWNVINDQDVVAQQSPPLLFKRAGPCAIINARGDLIVRPSAIERSAQRGLGSSISHHKLGSYNSSLSAVMRAQFRGKSLNGGTEGVGELAASEYVRELLLKPLGFRALSLQRYADSASGGTVAAAPDLDSTADSKPRRLRAAPGRVAPGGAAAAGAAAAVEDDLAGDVTSGEVASGGGPTKTLQHAISFLAGAVHDAM